MVESPHSERITSGSCRLLNNDVSGARRLRLPRRVPSYVPSISISERGAAMVVGSIRDSPANRICHDLEGWHFIC